MSKLYRVIITGRDVETGDVEEIHNDEHEGLMMMTSDTDGSMTEMIVHDTIANMAAKLAAGKKTRTAVKLAMLMMKIKDDDISDLEDMLSMSFGGED